MFQLKEGISFWIVPALPTLTFKTDQCTRYSKTHPKIVFPSVKLLFFLSLLRLYNTIYYSTHLMVHDFAVCFD